MKQNEKKQRVLTSIICMIAVGLGVSFNAYAQDVSLTTLGSEEVSAEGSYPGNYAVFYGHNGGVNTDNEFMSVAYSFDPTYRHSYEMAYRVLGSTSYAGILLYPGVLENGESGDIQSYSHLTFRIKGSVNNMSVKVELKNNSPASEGRNLSTLYIPDYLPGGITTTWQTVRIPIDAFANLDRLDNITGLSFVFEHDYANESGFLTSGTVQIDSVKFLTEGVDSVIFDSFGDHWGLNAMGGNMGDMPNSIPQFGPYHQSTYVMTEYHNNAWSLQSVYGVVVPPYWSGCWMNIAGGLDGFTPQETDLSAYNYLTFWVRAASAAENPKGFKIEIVDGSSTSVSKVAISNITTSWQKKTINLNNVSYLDKTTIKQINIVYENTVISSLGGSFTGKLYFDDIQFEK